MAVEHRPVDEQEPLLGARFPRGLADVPCEPPADPLEAQPLGHVREPEAVVWMQGAAGAEDDRRAVLRTGLARRRVEQVGKFAPEDAREDRIARQHGCGRASLDLVPRREGVTRVVQPDADVVRRERLGEGYCKCVPRERRRPVDCDDAGLLPGNLGGQGLESVLDRTPDDRVARVGVVAHAGGRSRRSIVNAALHEKSRAPSGSPVVGS